MKEIRRTVDDALPKWLHSRFLSAVDYIWQVKGDNEESIKRVEHVMDSGHFTEEEMSWIMLSAFRSAYPVLSSISMTLRSLAIFHRH